jgi:ArsR family transcriptional regulator, arsenate/arsenite/antimonite-responsive transcriptional repressor
VATVNARTIDRVTRGFRALADETRLRIIARLRDGEECVCNLTDLLETGQSRLSFHLKILRDAGILRARREGRWMYYSLDGDALSEIEDTVKHLRESEATRRACRTCG